MKQQRAALAEAHKAFAAADAEATRLRGRMDDIQSRLTQANATRARQELDLRNFALSGDDIDALAGKARSAAREAALARAEADAEAQFLTAALAEATNAWHGARAKIAQAEIEIRAAQYAESDAQVDALVAELWKMAKPTLRKILDSVHVASSVRPVMSLELERHTAINELGQCDFLLDAFAKLAKSDRDFDRPLPDVLALLPRSVHLSGRDRSLALPGMSVEQVARLLAKPEEQGAPPAFVPEAAVVAIRREEERIAALEHSIETIEAQAAREGARANASSKRQARAAEIDGKRSLIERSIAGIAMWRERLSEWRKANGHIEETGQIG